MTYDEKYLTLNSILSHTKHSFVYVSYEDFLDALIMSQNVGEHLKLTAYKASKLSNRIFPDKPKRGKLLNYALSLANLKNCTSCGSYLGVQLFYKNNYNPDGFNNHCIVCQSYSTAVTQPSRQAKYRASKLNRTPSWAELKLIKDFYDNCPTGYQVDHVIPLNGKSVSGLHVLGNLQYLLKTDNLSKSNKFTS